MFENEKIRLALAGDADERVVVILDDPVDFLVVAQAHAHRDLLLDQMLEVFGFLKRMFGRARPDFPPPLDATSTPTF